MATGILTDYPWLFRNYQTIRPSFSNLPQDSYEMADSRKPAVEKADTPGPAMKSAASKKPAKTAPTKTTPT